MVKYKIQGQAMKKQLEKVILNQDANEVKQLLTEGISISEFNLSEVLKVIIENETDVNIDFIKYLIENGIDIRKKVDFTIPDGDFLFKEVVKINALSIAIYKYNKQLIQLLLDNGLDFDNEEEIYPKNSLNKLFKMLDPLEQAINNDDHSLVQFLIDAGKYEGHSAVRYNFDKYCLNADLKMVQFLLEKGFSFNNGTPIASCTYGLATDYVKNSEAKYKKILRLLIANGADVNDPEMDMVSPFTYLFKIKDSEELDLELIQLFIENGADVNGRDEEGNTPLMLLPCISHRQGYATTEAEKIKSVIKLLLDNGAEINTKNNIGMTALMLYAIKKCSLNVHHLLREGADINITSNMTAFDLTSDDVIEELINKSRNHTPQKLVKILTNFTLDKPLKHTTHSWDFDLSKEYGDFDTFMFRMKKQFKSIQKELKKLSPNLDNKITTFLLEEDPKEDYSWCSKTKINMGWSSLKGLKEHCDSGKKPCDFKLPKPILLDSTTPLTTFGSVIDLFKQEIEVRRDFENLTTIFESIKGEIGNTFNLTTQKLGRQFYTDVEKFTTTLDKIFDGMKKHSDHKDIEVIANEFDDGTIELKIMQIHSLSTLNAKALFEEVEDGDFADIKENLTNLCDWSIEGSFDDDHFRINYLKSNNVKDIVELDYKPNGFTHILKFYKR